MSRQHRRRFGQLCRSLALFTWPLFFAVNEPGLAGPAQVVGPDSPPWLRAVGKLHVPGVKFERGHQLNHREDCSATLVAKAGSDDSANVIVTAWHCLEFYRDLSKAIRFTLLYGSDESFTTQAYRVVDGGGMHADWAILRLQQAVPSDTIRALKVHPEKADVLRPIVMAGYSKNSQGNQLSYDADCSILLPPNAGEKGHASNCSARKGASGGAVVQLSSQGEPLLAGVISQGDGGEFTVFVPVADFRWALHASLR